MITSNHSDLSEIYIKGLGVAHFAGHDSVDLMCYAKQLRYILIIGIIIKPTMVSVMTDYSYYMYLETQHILLKYRFLI